jgi:hypothetical protein
LEGVEIAAIADSFQKSNAYINFLLGGKMGIEYMKRLRLDKDYTSFYPAETWDETEVEIKGRKIFVLDGIPNLENFETRVISHPEEFYKLFE